MFKNRSPIIKWDEIIVCDNEVFLLESKNLVKQLNEFPNKLEAIDSAEFKQLVRKEYIGVVCGSLFPLKLRRKSMEEGLMVVFPGGNRYKVEAPQELNQPMQLCCDIC